MNLVFLIDLTYLDELKMYLQGESHLIIVFQRITILYIKLKLLSHFTIIGYA